MKDLVIYGSGALGRVVLEIAQDINEHAATWRVLGFLDDGPGAGGDVCGLPVLGTGAWLESNPGAHVAVAIGAPAARRKVVHAIRDAGHASFATLIHPRAWIGSGAGLGAGCILYPGAMVDPGVTVGAWVVINKLCTLGHDVVVGDFVTLAPAVNVSAYSTLETGCSLGTNCCTLNRVTVGAWSVVGAGSVVNKDIPRDVTAVGAPARVIKRRPAGWHNAPTAKA